MEVVRIKKVYQKTLSGLLCLHYVNRIMKSLLMLPILLSRLIDLYFSGTTLGILILLKAYIPVRSSFEPFGVARVRLSRLQRLQTHAA